MGRSVGRGRWTSKKICRLVSHTHTHTIDVIVDVRMTSCDVIVGIGMTSLPVYGHTECDTRLHIRVHRQIIKKYPQLISGAVDPMIEWEPFFAAKYHLHLPPGPLSPFAQKQDKTTITQ